MKKSNKEIFIEKSIKKHGNKCTYSLVEYINNNTKVKLICKIHGIFEQTPRAHLYGKAHGCQKCANNDYRYTLKEFIEKANKIHKSKYDYSLIKQINRRTIIEIMCPTHGVFHKRVDSHIEGSGCIKCNKNNKFTIEKSKFIEKSKIIHNDYYDYSLVDYSGTNNYVAITCKKHGTFIQTPHNHMKGKGCPSCKESKGEKNIAKILSDLKIKYIREKRFDDCKGKTHKLPFDFYLPDYNICIEFNGKQHYMPIKLFGGEKYFDLIKKRDKIKYEYCKINTIKLLVIKYDEHIYNTLNNFLKINNII